MDPIAVLMLGRLVRARFPGSGGQAMAKQKIFDAMEQDYAKEKPWLSLVLGALFALLIVFFILETLSGF
jgi:hypothetical protein